MIRTLDLTHLPKKKYGGKYTDWDASIGQKTPFKYDGISGDLEILDHLSKNRIVVGYMGRTKMFRTNNLSRMQYRDLIDPDNEQIHQSHMKTHETFIAEVYEKFGDEYTVLSRYRGSKKSVDIRHNRPVCGYNVFSPSPNNFLRGSGCPLCNGTPSLQEVCILNIVSLCYPDARKEKFSGRECDIVFREGNKTIGIQYDGEYYHQDYQRDEAFNQIFLEDENRYLIRMREDGCPEIKQHDRLYILLISKSSKKESIQTKINEVFSVVEMLLGELNAPVLSDEIFKQSQQQAQRSFRYKKLLEEYIEFLTENHREPLNREANDLQIRIARAIRNYKFDDADMTTIRAIRKELGLLNEYLQFLKEYQREPIAQESRNLLARVNKAIHSREFDDEDLSVIFSAWEQLNLPNRMIIPNRVYKATVKFHQENGILPRQQRGRGEEGRLHRDLAYCMKNNLFSEKQLETVSLLRNNTPNYATPADRLVIMFVEFVNKHERLPGAGTEPGEKSLMSKVKHRLHRNSFSHEQHSIVEELRFMYSPKHVLDRIVSEYEAFITENKRLPYYNAEGAEGKLEKNIVRYLKNDSFSAEEKRKVLELREVYQKSKTSQSKKTDTHQSIIEFM